MFKSTTHCFIVIKLYFECIVWYWNENSLPTIIFCNLSNNSSWLFRSQMKIAAFVPIFNLENVILFTNNEITNSLNQKVINYFISHSKPVDKNERKRQEWYSFINALFNRNFKNKYNSIFNFNYKMKRSEFCPTQLNKMKR